VDVDDDWRADLRLALQGGRLVVSECRVYPRKAARRTLVAGRAVMSLVEPKSAPPAGEPWGDGEEWGLNALAPAGGILIQLLRRVPLHSYQRVDVDIAEHEGLAAVLSEGAALLRAFPSASTPRRGRPPIPDDKLLSVAMAYDKAVRAGRRPIQAVKQLPGMTEAKARDLVHRARLRGLLTPATWGLAGGKLTAKARELLAARKTRRKR
jgi:hypothetical protein